jgi:hypothetical protein
VASWLVKALPGRREGWSEAQVAGLMPYFEYTVTGYKRDGDLVVITAGYKEWS